MSRLEEDAGPTSIELTAVKLERVPGSTLARVVGMDGKIMPDLKTVEDARREAHEHKGIPCQVGATKDSSVIVRLYSKSDFDARIKHDRAEEKKKLEAQIGLDDPWTPIGAKAVHLKTITSEHDLNVKVKQLEDFLRKGKRCFVYVQMKRRRDLSEQVRQDTIHEMLHRVARRVEALCTPSRQTEIRDFGRNGFATVLKPLPQSAEAKKTAEMERDMRSGRKKHKQGGSDSATGKDEGRSTDSETKPEQTTEDETEQATGCDAARATESEGGEQSDAEKNVLVTKRMNGVS